MTSWINNRVAERTSWDGAALVAVGVVILFAGPFAKIAAYAAIAYGAWTIWKSEQNLKMIYDTQRHDMLDAVEHYATGNIAIHKMERHRDCTFENNNKFLDKTLLIM